MERPRKIRAVLLDWDDNVVATHQNAYELHQKFAQKQGLVCPPIEHLRTLWGKSLDKVLEGMYPQLSNCRALFDASVPIDFHFKPLPGAVEAIKKLRENRKVIGVVSSGPQESIRRSISLSAPEISDHFFFIHAAEDCKVHKPDPSVFDEAFEKLAEKGILEDETVYIGDSVGDYHAARDRGILFYATLTGFTSKDQFLQLGLLPNHIFLSLLDAANVII